MWAGLGRPVLASMTVTSSLRLATRSGLPASTALLPRRLKEFCPSVRTVYPWCSHLWRCSFSRAVWFMSQPVWSKSEGMRVQLQPSCWALNQLAHSQELSPESSRGSQVTHT